MGVIVVVFGEIATLRYNAEVPVVDVTAGSSNHSSVASLDSHDLHPAPHSEGADDTDSENPLGTHGGLDSQVTRFVHCKMAELLPPAQCRRHKPILDSNDSEWEAFKESMDSQITFVYTCKHEKM